MTVCGTDSQPSFLLYTLYAEKVCEEQIGTCVWHNCLHIPPNPLCITACYCVYGSSLYLLTQVQTSS